MMKHDQVRKPRRTPVRNLFRVECLDDRVLPSVTLTGGVLKISGTSRGDQIEVDRAGNILLVSVNGKTSRFDQLAARTSVHEMQISGGAGNDSIRIDDRVGSLNATIDGGAGNDSIRGGAGDDSIGGGSGDDSIDGGAGNDHESGDAGNDSITGGAGDDSLDGGAGTNSLNTDTSDTSRIVDSGQGDHSNSAESVQSAAKRESANRSRSADQVQSALMRNASLASSSAASETSDSSTSDSADDEAESQGSDESETEAGDDSQSDSNDDDGAEHNRDGTGSESGSTSQAVTNNSDLRSSSLGGDAGDKVVEGGSDPASGSADHERSPDANVSEQNSATAPVGEAVNHDSTNESVTNATVSNEAQRANMDVTADSAVSEPAPTSLVVENTSNSDEGVKRSRTIRRHSARQVSSTGAAPTSASRRDGRHHATVVDSVLAEMFADTPQQN